jgi:branched-chain amino acid aminotransferase
MAVFGTVFMPQMALATFVNDKWTDTEFVSADSISLHPGAHVLHYSSTCFEGLKAFKHEDAASIYLEWIRTLSALLKVAAF